MVGLMNELGEATILSEPDEEQLLEKVRKFLLRNKPNLLVGHNLFNFDLPFLMSRCEKHEVTHPFRWERDRYGRVIESKKITSSNYYGNPISFKPARWTGVDIIDTLHQVCIWDKSAAKLDNYRLKSSVLALGLREEQRLELSNDEIQQCWQSGNTEPLAEYLRYDLEDTQLLADFLLPVVYYQKKIVPDLSLQDLAIASPALKAQKIHCSLLPSDRPIADESLKYEGGTVECVAPGLHRNVAKIDISSLYPSIMLRYGICSRKDKERKFLGVLKYMTQQRLQLKQLAKSGDTQANHEQNALKILINGSYGFLGTAFYSFNDYEAAALVTAIGRKILKVMGDVVEDCGGTVIELDTDGIFFSHPNPEGVNEKVQRALPEGINAELELANCGMYVPKSKSYVVVHPGGKLTVKGLFRKRNRYPLEKAFPIEFLKRYFLKSSEQANAYYQETRNSIAQREISVKDLTVTRKIATNEKRLVELGLGQPGDKVSYYYKEEKRFHARTGKPSKSQKLECTEGDYWIEHYLEHLDKQHHEMTLSYH